MKIATALGLAAVSAAALLGAASAQAAGADPFADVPKDLRPAPGTPYIGGAWIMPTADTMTQLAAAVTSAAAGCAASRRMTSVVGIQPGFLGRAVDAEQEHPVEQVQQFTGVGGDAADKNRLARTSQDFPHAVAAPYPAVRAEPLLIGTRRAAGLVDPVTSGVQPERELRVMIRVDGPQATPEQLRSQGRLA